MPERSRRRQVINPFQGENGFRRSHRSGRSLKERILNPFSRSERPLWLKIVWTPIDILLAIILLPIVVVLVPLVGCVIVPLLFVFAAISGMVSRDRNDDLEVHEPPGYWPTSECTITSEHFGELHVTRHGHAWLKANFPAFTRFGGRYEEFADWVYADLPPPGEIAVVLGDQELSAERANMQTYRRLLDLLERHQVSIADAIQQRVREAAWLEEDEMGDVDDRFRISRADLLCLSQSIVMLMIDQTWDTEHAWFVEIAGLTDEGFESLEIAPM